MIERTLMDHLKVFVFLLVVVAVIFSLFSKGPFKFDLEELSGSEVKETKNSVFDPIEIISYVLLGSFILAILLYKNKAMNLFKEKGKINQNIVNYIQDAKKKGFSKNQIKNRLYNEGWDIMDVDTTFSKLKTAKFK